MNRADKRISIDIKNLKNSAENVNISGNILTFTINGPKDSYYEGGKWKVRIEILKDYPYKSPSVGFIDKIYHPNVDYKSGSICLNVLNQTWTPIYNLNHIYDIFLPQLLSYPNPDDPLNESAANDFKNNIEEFKRKIKINNGIKCK